MTRYSGSWVQDLRVASVAWRSSGEGWVRAEHSSTRPGCLEFRTEQAGLSIMSLNLEMINMGTQWLSVINTVCGRTMLACRDPTAKCKSAAPATHDARSEK